MEVITLARTSFIQQIFIEKFLCASAHSDISFLAPAKGEKLIAKAVCVKNGKTTACYRVDVTDESGKLTATVTVTGCHIA